MNRKLVDAWFGAFHNKDIVQLERTLAEEFVHHSPFGAIKSRQAYLALVRENTEAFFSPTIEILDILGSGDKFAARYLVNGNPACDCIYVRDGQITEIFSYYHYGEKPSF
ncbi:nuclear transport factor 2 family protein [Candidatus Leptofilum sp.]|uniref:nuclear transport factor 2 family protein n=1 Tax=Candidatus Leptofilum sp. TaxID=3241576 RepID=UPI003B58CB74